MNEKKTVLFIANGFGVETKSSFEVYSKEVMPTFEKIINAYPFKLLYASGEFIGNNKEEASNYRDGYFNFSTFGNPTTKYDILKKKIQSNEFLNNEVVNKSIDVAVENKSRLHIMFTVGDKVNIDRYEQLNTYLELAKSKGIDKVFAHIILGDSSVKDQKIARKCINDFRNRVIRYNPFVKIASVCGNKYGRDGDQNDIAEFYKMMVSGIGEVWTDYEDTINKKYERGMTDDTMNGFITVRENLLRDGDSMFMFTYSNTIGTKFLKVLLNPKQFYPTSKVPENIIVHSLFKFTEIPDVPYAFENELPSDYFFDKIPEDKKVLIIADKDRVQYISSCLNGVRPTFKKNVSIWPIEDKKNRFQVTSQYLAAYINQNTYDLIIVDCELYEPSVDEKSIAQIKKNLEELDKCVNIVFTQVMDKNYRLMFTSLYGIKSKFKLTETMELVDLSQKVPFLLVDKEIRKVDLVFKKYGTFLDVARLIATTYGNKMKNELVVLDSDDEKKSTNKKKLLILIPVVALLILIILYIKVMYL